MACAARHGVVVPGAHVPPRPSLVARLGWGELRAGVGAATAVCKAPARAMLPLCWFRSPAALALAAPLLLGLAERPELPQAEPGERLPLLFRGRSAANAAARSGPSAVAVARRQVSCATMIRLRRSGFPATGRSWRLGCCRVLHDGTLVRPALVADSEGKRGLKRRWPRVPPTTTLPTPCRRSSRLPASAPSTCTLPSPR